jgi:hypothetical protein
MFVIFRAGGGGLSEAFSGKGTASDLSAIAKPPLRWWRNITGRRP